MCVDKVVKRPEDPFPRVCEGLCPWITSIKYKVERDERYLPYIELGRWLCSHFQLETPLNFHKPVIQKLYIVEQRILHHWIP